MKDGKETSLVRVCLQWLELRGVLAWRVNSGAMVVGDRKHRRFVRFNSIDGVSDILGCLPGGRMLAVECKVKPNKLTRSQESFLAAVQKNGGVAVVAYSLDDLAQVVDERIPR